AGHRSLRSPRRIHQKEETHVEEVLSRERRRHERSSNEFNDSATSADLPADPSKDLPMERLRRAFGRNDYLLPENFKTLRRSDIPVTYRLHDDLLRLKDAEGNLRAMPRRCLVVDDDVDTACILDLCPIRGDIPMKCGRSAGKKIAVGKSGEAFKLVLSRSRRRTCIRFGDG
ncbi:hypothetical protein ANCDUO_19866, partial [Ancylostoma duodenale]